MPRKIECVTFDCYGTLIDWQGGIEKALRGIPAIGGDVALARRIVALREEIEKPMLVSAPDLPEEETEEETYETPEYRPYREILAESLVLAASSVGVEISPAESESAAASMSDWEPFPDTRAALAELKRHFKLAILSNAENEVIAASIARIGIPFDLVVTAEKVESYKPAPDHWYAAMHELEADEEDLFHLAASPFHDLETATLLGIPNGYVNRGGYQLTREASPLFVVPDLAAAVQRLRGHAPKTPRSAVSQPSGDQGRRRGAARGRPRYRGGPGEGGGTGEGGGPGGAVGAGGAGSKQPRSGGGAGGPQGRKRG